MVNELIISPAAVRVSRCSYSVFRHFDLGDSTKGEEQLDQICRRILGSLANDVADRGGHGRVKENASRLHSSKIHAHCLSRLKGSHDSPLTRLWSQSPTDCKRDRAIHGVSSSAGITPAILKPYTSCKRAGGTPALLNPASPRASTFQKSIVARLTLLLFAARDNMQPRGDFFFSRPRRRRPCDP